MSATGPGGPSSIASCTCWIMRLTVSVEKSGALKSGVCISTPCAESLDRKNAAFDECADEAKPCRYSARITG